jgi:hypothetical protein
MILMNSQEDCSPKRQDAAKWIDTSWRSISIQTITNTWSRFLAFKETIINTLPPIKYNQFEQNQMDEDDNFLEFDQDPFHSVGPIPENSFH